MLGQGIDEKESKKTTHSNSLMILVQLGSTRTHPPPLFQKWVLYRIGLFYFSESLDGPLLPPRPPFCLETSSWTIMDECPSNNI